MLIDQTVLEAKRYGVLSCTSQTSLSQAAQQMVEEDVSALVVIDQDGSLQGIITRTDLLRALKSDQDWQVHTVSDYMSPDVVTVSEKTSIREVAVILLEQQIHRVVVIKHEQNKILPISVVSAADIVYHMTQKSADD